MYIKVCKLLISLLYILFFNFVQKLKLMCIFSNNHVHTKLTIILMVYDKMKSIKNYSFSKSKHQKTALICFFMKNTPQIHGSTYFQIPTHFNLLPLFSTHPTIYCTNRLTYPPTLLTNLITLQPTPTH